MFGFVRRMFAAARQGYYRIRLGGLGVEADIGTGMALSYPQRIVIGNRCHIARNVSLRANTEHVTGIRIGDDVSLHEFVLVAANNGSVEIGDRSWLAPFCLVYGNGGVRIGNDVLIAPRVSINTVSHHADSCAVPINDQGIYCDPVTIEDDVWIGMHAVILQGVTIGRGAIIGAGAVVNKDVPAWSIAVGVPAKVVGRRKNAPELET